MDGDGKQARVLIVDDVARVREALRSVLALEGDLRVVGEASDGQQAVDLTASLSPDLVLMDLEMPIVDGYTATEHIKRLGQAPVVVALSIHADREARERSTRAGVDAFVEKGAPIPELLRVIRSVLP